MLANIKTILVLVDFDQSSDAALDAAINLAHLAGARLVLLHVWNAAWSYDVPAFAMNDITLEIGKGARAAMDSRLAQVRTRCAEATAIVRQGSVLPVALEVIGETKCDLVAMGTHGRKGLAHAFLGSVAEKVVRLSPVPVLTVPPGT